MVISSHETGKPRAWNEKLAPESGAPFHLPGLSFLLYEVGPSVLSLEGCCEDEMGWRRGNSLICETDGY